MTNTKRNIIAITYLISMTMAIWGGFISTTTDFNLIISGGTLMMIPWVMSIHDAATNNKGAMWIYFLVTFGAIAIPSYLISNRKRNESPTGSIPA